MTLNSESSKTLHFYDLNRHRTLKIKPIKLSARGNTLMNVQHSLDSSTYLVVWLISAHNINIKQKNLIAKLQTLEHWRKVPP